MKVKLIGTTDPFCIKYINSEGICEIKEDDFEYVVNVNGDIKDRLTKAIKYSQDDKRYILLRSYNNSYRFELLGES